MNREIKFRALDAAYNQLYYSQDYYGTHGDPSGLSDFFKTHKNDQVMQYTGLKDANGKEIYEGDIIATPTRFVHDTLDAFGVVTYLGTGFKSVGFGDFAGGQYGIQYDSEVLGNIHEHPRLLENAIIPTPKTPAQ